MKQRKVIISGGGTGGHIFPAIAIANALKLKLGDSVDILFVGALGRMEMEKVPAAGYKIEGLWISGLQRKLSIENLKLPFKLISSFVKAHKIISSFKPDVVVGVGGYASGVIMRAATQRVIPTLIQEQNSYPGITNKILAPKAKKICVAYPGMERFFPADKIMLTGNPVRQDIKDIDSKRNEAFAFFGLSPAKKTILIIGGSLGARTINESILACLNEYIKNDIQLIWQTGKSYIATAQSELRKINSPNIFCSDFIYKMDLAYAAADLVISRAGASSVSELAIVEKACILVPSPNVAEDHQTKNAMALVSKNAAVLVTDKNANAELTSKAIALLNNENELQSLRSNIKLLAMTNSADVIAEEVLKCIKE